MSGVKKSRRRGYTRLSPKRQVTVPVSIVEQVGLQPGDELRVEADRAGRIVMTRAGGDVRERRLRAIEETAGTLTGAFEPAYLDRLREEWR